VGAQGHTLSGQLVRERTDRRHRRQARLGRLTPIDYETIMTRPAYQAG